MTREQLEQRRELLLANIAAIRKEFANEKGAKLQAALVNITELESEVNAINEQINGRYVPFHYQDQLISPRSLFVSPLFTVKNKTMVREEYFDKEIPVEWHGSLKYSGPELRQSDALVFAGLINLVQEFQVGSTVQFNVEEFCMQIFGAYDGHVRDKLKEHIIRLQTAVLRFNTFSVQLCLRFDYPAEKHWSVALDPELVFLFKERYTWISLNKRKTLREGLSTWLYAYISCHKVLTKISIEQIKILSGSDAETRSFTNTLRNALQDLQNHQILDSWKISRGIITWSKESAIV